MISRLADRVDPSDVGAQIAVTVVDAIPELARRADDDLRRTAERTAARTLADIWETLRAGGSPEEIVPPRDALAFAVELVHRGVEIEGLLRAYRMGHDIVERAWESAADEMDIDPELRWRALAAAFRYFFKYVDAVSVQLTRAYADERARWVRGSAVVRAEMVQSLLEGEKVPAARASAALGYDVGLRHVGFIVWADPTAPDPGNAVALEGVAANAARALGDGPSMLTAVGNWIVWGWVTVDSSADTAVHEPIRTPDGVHVAVGSPSDGPDGFVRTHREAAQARRVATLLGRRAGATVHRRVALLGLLSADADAAARFVESELGELIDPTDSMARLRATLRVYLDENASPARTSRRLSINKNTVVYRVAKAEEILGHGILERRSELDAALRLCEVIDGLRELAVTAP